MLFNYPGLIEFKLEKIGNPEIRFEIYSQSPSITRLSSSVPIFRFESSDGYVIDSSDFVDLTSDRVWIRGPESLQTGPVYSVTNSDGVYDRVLKAFDELAASLGISLAGTIREHEQLSFWD